MIALFFQSASAQAAQAQAEAARACDSIASTYRFYSASWEGPKTSLQDTALRRGLTTVAQTALRNRFGIEGGVWAADSGSLAIHYAKHGEPNGVILESGEFIHTRPHGMKKLRLRVGSKVVAHGERRMTVLGTILIEAREVNRVTIE